MTRNRNTHDDESDRLALDSLVPRPAWITGLPDLGRDAARSREEQGSWSAGFAFAGRWFLPLAAVVTALCWIVSSLLGPARSPRSPLVLAGSDREALVAFTLEARR